jgi:hypothetical protein
METNNDISIDPELQFAQNDLQVAEKTIAALKNGRNIRGKFVSKKDLPAAKKAANKALDSALTRIAKIEQKTLIASAKSKVKADAEAKKLQRAAEQKTAKERKEQEAAAAKSQRAAEQQTAKAQKEQAAAAAKSQKQQDQDSAQLAETVSTPSTATATMDPPKSVMETEKDVSTKIGLLESLKAQRQAQGYKSDALEDYIIGTSKQQGVRSTVEDYIRENKEKFNQDDPAGAAAYELMEETVALSEASLDASHEEAKRIYANLNFIRELAKKTQGDQGEIAKKLQEIIAPVEAQLKKKSSFKAFLMEKASDFKKTIPERIASKIPVIGGILGDFFQQKRISREKMERYTGGLQKQISRRGRRGEGLDISAPSSPSAPKGQGFSDIGGTPAADVPGMFASYGSPQSPSTATGINSTLGELLKEVSEIRKLLQNKFAPASDTEELTKRESELEGEKDSEEGGSKKGSGIVSKGFKAIAKLFGFGDKKESSLAKAATSTATSTAMDIGKEALKIGGGGAVAGGAYAGGSALLGGGAGAGAGAAAGTGVGAGAGVGAGGAAGAGGALASVGSALAVIGTALGGILIGGGVAYGINSAIDAAFGTNLAELMLQSDTYTGADIQRDAKFDRDVKISEAKQKNETSTPEYISKMSEDPRNLQKLVSEKKITGEQALAKLAEFEQKNGAGADTNVIRENITNTMNAKPLVEDGKTKPAKIADATSGSTTAVKAGESATATANISGATNFTVDHPVIKEWIDKQRPELRNIERAKFNALSTTKKNQLGRHLTRTAKNPDGSSYSTEGGIDEVEIPTAEEMAEMSPERREFYEELAEKKARKSNPPTVNIVPFDKSPDFMEPEGGTLTKEAAGGAELLSGSTTAVNAGQSATAAAKIPTPPMSARRTDSVKLPTAEEMAGMSEERREFYEELIEMNAMKSGTYVGRKPDGSGGIETDPTGTIAKDPTYQKEVDAISAIRESMKGGGAGGLGISGKRSTQDSNYTTGTIASPAATQDPNHPDYDPPSTKGTIASPATANTTVGKMVDQVAEEQNNLNQAKNGSAPAGSNTSNTSNVQNKISNTTNNFNDDIRIRNNEPTIKQMQASTITF